MSLLVYFPWFLVSKKIGDARHLSILSLLESFGRAKGYLHFKIAMETEGTNGQTIFQHNVLLHARRGLWEELNST